MRWIVAFAYCMMCVGQIATAAMPPTGAIAPAGVRVLLTDTAQTSPIGRFVEIFEDQTGDLTFNDVSSSASSAAAFARSAHNIPNFGFSPSAYWVRFTAQNQTQRAATWLMEIGNPFIDVIQVYECRDGALVGEKTVGDTIPFHQRDVPHRNFIFPFNLAAQEEITYYVRFQNKGRMAIAITLWQPLAFTIHEYHQQFGSGLFYGAVLIMLGYNALLFLLLKEPIYGKYVLLLASVAVMLLSNEGFAYQYLWPDFPWWNDVSLNAFIGVTSMLSLWFSAQFLRLSAYSRPLYLSTVALRWVWGVLTALFVVTRHSSLPQLIIGLALPGPLLLIAAAFVIWRKGYQPARYYLLSWGIFFAGAFVEVLGMYNLIPVEWFNGRGLRFGLVLALAFISLALSDRINLLKSEKADAQANALLAAQENERLIREQNLLLEQKVAERTAELRTSNDQLHQEVAERKRAELALRAAHRELQQKNQELQDVNASKDKFFSIISHDLRSPLSVILGMTELLRGNFDHYTPDRAKELLTRMNAAAERLNMLLENLLTWSRLQRGAMEYRPEKIDLRALAEESRDLLLARAEQKDVALANVIPPNTSAFADYDMINTVIRNLVSNALKFTTAGDRIELSASCSETTAEVSVCDTGTGMSSEDLAQLFRIDVQHSSIGTAGERGTGIGLILCQELVERNGGTIWADSRLGEGTTFRFTLPAQKK